MLAVDLLCDGFVLSLGFIVLVCVWVLLFWWFGWLVFGLVVCLVVLGGFLGYLVFY